MGLRLVAAAVALAAAGCDWLDVVTNSFETNEFSGDPFPIHAELTSGAVVLGARLPDGAERTAVLDVLSPVTLIDPGPDVPPSFDTTDLLVLGQDGPGGALARPRALLSGVDLLSLHPCAIDQVACLVGPSAAPRPYDALIGADALDGDALRLRLGDEQVFVVADIGGPTLDRTRSCDAVFPGPFQGGGTLLIAGTERSFPARRIAIEACLGAVPDPTLSSRARGADALLVMSTGLGVSLLGEAAYLRYLGAYAARLAPAPLPDAMRLEQLPVETVNLPAGPITGRRGSLDRLALVASSSQSALAACRQVYASHFMVQRDCVKVEGSTDERTGDCPCEDGEVFCDTPAVVELAPPTGLEVLIVPDADPTLQALRTELRPAQAEVDGILGTNALRTAELDIDYPHGRLLARCTADGCVARPALPERTDRPQIQGCLEYAPPGPAF